MFQLSRLRKRFFLSLLFVFYTHTIFADTCEDIADPKKVTVSDDDYFIAVLRINNRPVAESIDVYRYLDTHLIPVTELGKHFGLSWQYQAVTNTLKSDAKTSENTGLCDFQVNLGDANPTSKYVWAEDDYGTYIDVNLLAAFIMGSAEFNVELQQMNFISIYESLGLANQSTSREAFFNEIEIKDYPIIRSSYRKLSSPIVNYNIVASQNHLGRSNTRISSNIYSDVLGLSGEYRINHSNNRTDQFIKFSRNILFDDSQAIKMGNIQTLEDRANKFEIGDISLQGDELLFETKQGIGLNLFSYSQNQRSNFSNIRIEETALPGWRALLFRNGEFLREVNVNENNQIVFEDVPTFFGVNSFSLSLYGPEGQKRTRTKIVRVGDGQQEKGLFDYQLSAINASETLINGSHQALDFDKRISGIARYGLSDQLTLSAESHATKLLNGEQNNLFAYALDYSNTNSVFRFKYADNAQAGNAWFAGLNASLSEDYTGNISIRKINNIQSEIYDKYQDLQSEYKLRLNGRLSFPFKTSFNISATQKDFADGEQQRSISLQQSQNLAFGTYSNSLSYSSIKESEQINHRFFYSSFFGAWQLRQSLAWQPFEKQRIQKYTATLRWPNQHGVFNETSFDYSNQSKDVFELRHQVNWRSPRFNFQFGGSINNQGIWSVRLGVSGSLYQNQNTRELNFTQAKGTTSRRILAEAFIDSDRNGIRSEEETLLQNIEFSGRPNWKGKQTKDNGRIELFTQSDYQSIGIDETSLQDPFLAPLMNTKIINVHPGGQARVSFALAPVNDIEGSIVFNKKGSAKTNGIFGLEIELTNVETNIQYQASTESDGYFFFSQVPPGTYHLTIGKEQLAELGFASFDAIEVEAPSFGDIVTLDEIMLVPSET